MDHVQDVGTLDDKGKKLFFKPLESYLCLWNTSPPVYKDKIKKVEASKALSMRFGLTIEDMKKLMHSLRTSMVREVKRTKDSDNYVSKRKFFIN